MSHSGAKEGIGIQEISRAKLYRQVGIRIRKAREAKVPKVTQADLAKSLDVERTSITNVEKGMQRATLLFLYNVAQKLQVPLESLLPDLDDPAILEGLITNVAEVLIGKKKRTVPASIKSIIDKV